MYVNGVDVCNFEVISRISVSFALSLNCTIPKERFPVVLVNSVTDNPSEDTMDEFDTVAFGMLSVKSVAFKLYGVVVVPVKSVAFTLFGVVVSVKSVTVERYDDVVSVRFVRIVVINVDDGSVVLVPAASSVIFFSVDVTDIVVVDVVVAILR